MGKYTRKRKLSEKALARRLNRIVFKRAVIYFDKVLSTSRTHGFTVIPKGLRIAANSIVTLLDHKTL